MKAIGVYPGQPNSMHIEEIPMPQVTDIAGGCGVLVKVLRVGLDGTDKEINAAEYGMAPDGSHFLIIGHESFGQVGMTRFFGVIEAKEGAIKVDGLTSRLSVTALVQYLLKNEWHGMPTSQHR
jgi:threonine dehydrogenase-like Zn-dependent dehydrogenase